MKRFLIMLFFLVIVGGVVFYFGWVQIHIPAGGYGVIFTRTNGWEPDVVEPGAFVWRWQRLIPTNLTLYVFEPSVHRTPVRVQGSLPSSDAIDAILDEPGEFDFDVRFTVETRLEPARLPALARDRELRPDDLDSYYDNLDARISEIATQAILSVVESQPDRLTAGSVYTTLNDELRSDLARELSDIQVTAVAIDRIAMPDMELYLTARDLAQNVLRARAAALEQAAQQLARTQAESDRGLSMLERYGEILDRYPVLLDYFRVGQEINGDPLNLESIIPQTGQ